MALYVNSYVIRAESMFVVASKTPSACEMFPQSSVSLVGVKGQEVKSGCECGVVGWREKGGFIQFPSKLSTYQKLNEQGRETDWLALWMRCCYTTHYSLCCTSGSI